MAKGKSVLSSFAKTVVNTAKNAVNTAKKVNPSTSKSKGNTKSTSLSDAQKRAQSILNNRGYIPPEDRVYTLSSPDGKKTLGNISYNAKVAIENNRLSKYEPKDDSERKVLDLYSKYVKESKKEDKKSHPVFEKYNLNQDEFSFEDLEKWANEHDFYFVYTDDGPGFYLEPKKKGGFLGIGGKKIPTKQEEEDSKVLVKVLFDKGNRKMAESTGAFGDYGAFGYGFIDGITSGTVPSTVSKKEKSVNKKLGLDGTMTTKEVGEAVMANNPVWGFIGETTGSVLSALLFGNLVSAGVGALNKGEKIAKVVSKVPALKNLSPTTQKIVSKGIEKAIVSGTTFGTTNAVRTGAEGGDAGDVVKAGLIGTASGIAGSIAETAVTPALTKIANKVGTKKLAKRLLEATKTTGNAMEISNEQREMSDIIDVIKVIYKNYGIKDYWLPQQIARATASVAFDIASTGTSIGLNTAFTEGYDPAEHKYDIAKEAVVSLIFSAIYSYSDYNRVSKENKNIIKRAVEPMSNDIHKISVLKQKGKFATDEYIGLADRMLKNSEKLKKVFNSADFVGIPDEQKQLLAGLNLIDDYVKTNYTADTVTKPVELTAPKTENTVTGIFDKNVGTKSNFANQSDVDNYIDYAYLYADETNVKGNTDFPKQKSGIVISKVDDRLASDMQKYYGIDISDAHHVIRDNDIRHIKNSHGEGTNEKYPVTAEDQKKIPGIIKNYDDVIYLQSSGNKDGIYYVKQHNEVTYYLEQIRQEGKLLSNKQMIKVPTGTIPTIPGLKEAIYNKWSTASGPDDASIPRMYVPDVKKTHTPDNIIAEKSDVVNSVNAEADFSAGIIKQFESSLAESDISEESRKHITKKLQNIESSLKKKSYISDVIETITDNAKAISSAFEDKTGIAPDYGKLIESGIKAVSDTGTDVFHDVASDYTDIYLDIIGSKKGNVQYKVLSESGADPKTLIMDYITSGKVPEGDIEKVVVFAGKNIKNLVNRTAELSSGMRDIVVSGMNNESAGNVAFDGEVDMTELNPVDYEGIASYKDVTDLVGKYLKPEIKSNTALMNMLEEQFGGDGVEALARNIIMSYEDDGSIGNFEALFTDGGKAIYDILNEKNQLNSDLQLTNPGGHDIIDDKVRYALNAPGSLQNNFEDETYTLDYVPFEEKKALDTYLFDNYRNAKNGAYVTGYTADSCYVCEKIGDKNYKVYDVFDLEADYDKINDIEEAIKNGSFRNEEEYNQWLSDYRGVQGINNSNQLDVGGGRTDGQIDSLHTEDLQNNREASDRIRPTQKSTGNQESNNQHGGRNLLSDGSSKRQNGTSAGKPIKGVDGRTRRYKEGRGTAYERRKFCQTQKASGHTEQRIINGHKCEVIPEKYYTGRMKDISGKNEKEGYSTVFVTGDVVLSIKDKNGRNKTAKGVYIRKNGKKTIIIQYDNYYFMPEQINDHEKIHDRYETRLVQKVRNIIVNSLSVSKRNNILKKLSRDYNEIVEGNEEALYEEFIANTLSGMNEYTDEFNEVVKAFWNNDEKTLDSFKTSEYTEIIDSGGGKSEIGDSISYAVEKKWHPDLSKAKLDILMRKIKSDIKRSKNHITDSSNWFYTDIDGTNVFAIYSTDDFENPTLLYESKGKKAEKERNVLLNQLEVMRYGESVDGKSRTINRVSGSGWLQQSSGIVYSNGALGRGSSNQNAGVLQRQSKSYGSRAFRSVLENLLEIQRQDRSSTGMGRGRRGRGNDVVKFSISSTENPEFWNEWIENAIQTTDKKSSLSESIKYDKASSTDGTDRWVTEEMRGNKSKDVNIADVVKQIRKKFGIPVATGKVTDPEASGVYKNRPETIRTRVANNLPTISHELGHHLDKKYHLSNLKSVNALRGAVSQELLNKYPEKERDGEAVAEFVRTYLKNVNEAKRLSPEFYDEFVKALSTEDLKSLNGIASSVNKYLSYKISERYDAVIVSSQKKEKIPFREKWHKWYSDWVDTFHPQKQAVDFVENITGMTLSGKNNAYTLATNSLNAHAISNYLICDGFRDLNGNLVNAKSFIDSIGMVDSKNVNLLDKYLVLRHSLEWITPMHEDVRVKRVFADDTLENAEEIKKQIAIIEKKHPEIKKAAENLYEYQNNVLKYFVIPAGGMTEKTLSELNRKYPSYVPFYRAVGNGTSVAKGTFANQRSPIMRAKGSGALIISPTESIIRNTEKMVKFALRNQVMSIWAKYADTVDGFGQYMEKVTPDMIPHFTDITFKKEKFSDALQQIVSSGEDYFAVTGLLDDIFGDAVTDFTPIANANKKIVTVMENGKPSYYQIHNDEFYESVAELSPQQTSGLLKVMNNIMQPMKLLITQNNPIFAVTNALRDFGTAYKLSETNNPMSFTAQYVKAFFGIISNSESYKQYRAMGGGHSSELSANIENISKTLRNVAQKDMGKARKLAYSIFRHPIETVASMNDAIESVPRFSEFLRTLNNGGDLQEAIFNAGDITTNFKRSGKGSTAKAVNKLIMFNNAAIQGLDKTFRTITSKDKKKRYKTLIKLFTHALIVGMVGYLYNRKVDEEGYKNLSAYKKNNFYNYAIGDGMFISLPKPRENAVIDTLAERLIEYMVGNNKEAFYDFDSYLGLQLLPPMIPDTLQPVDAVHSVFGSTIFGGLVDVGFNQDFKGSPIESVYDTFSQSNERYSDNTTKIAYELGQTKLARDADMSPKKIDHLISSYTGILGQVNKALFPMNENRRDKSIGLKNKFISDSNYSTDVLNKIYENEEKAKKNYLFYGTADTAVEYEQNAILTSYISGMNDAINALPEDERRDGRAYLLKTLNNWKYDNTASQTKMLDVLGDSTVSEDCIFDKLPGSEFEWTIDKQKYVYQMTPQEYYKYVNDYLTVVENARKHYGRNTVESYESAKQAAKKYMSDYKKNVLKERYKKKFVKKAG